MANPNPKSQKTRSFSPSVTPPKYKKSAFWQQWQIHQKHLYQCCLRWMRYNSTDLEDIMSQAMFKAWREWQKAEGQIKYPKAWFTRIIYNFCIDVHRKNKREALIIEKIEEIKFEDCPGLPAQGEFPECNILEREMQLYLHHQIQSLPTRLCVPFLLYYCQDKSYRDIAKQLACSEDNVRKCVRKACKILQQRLVKYIAGEDDAPLDALSPSFNWESLMLTISQDEDISYPVTLFCQESLPHHWYNSVSPWGWR